MATKPKTTAVAHNLPTKNLCCITIGFEHLLLPVEKGLKVIELLKDAVCCQMNYGARREYYVQDVVELEFKSITASSLLERRPVPEKPAAGDQP